MTVGTVADPTDNKLMVGTGGRPYEILILIAGRWLILRNFNSNTGMMADAKKHRYARRSRDGGRSSYVGQATGPAC